MKDLPTLLSPTSESNTDLLHALHVKEMSIYHGKEMLIYHGKEMATSLGLVCEGNVDFTRSI